jgi:hypothetical protein
MVKIAFQYQGRAEPVYPHPEVTRLDKWFVPLAIPQLRRRRQIAGLTPVSVKPLAAIQYTVITQWTRVIVQADYLELPFSTATVSAHVEVLRHGEWVSGTTCEPRCTGTTYARDHYGNVINLKEGTAYQFRVVTQFLSGETVIREVTHDVGTHTTLTSVVPVIMSGRISLYVDSINGANTNTGFSPAQAKANLNGSGANVTAVIAASNDRGYDIYIINGGWATATTSLRRLASIRGAANDWIRILPYPDPTLNNNNPRFHNERAFDGAWTSEGGGAYSMDISGEDYITGVNTIANLWDSTTGRQLYPFKTFDDFDDGTIGDGTGYWIDVSSSVAADTLFVRLAGGANPGTGRLIGAFGTGLLLQAIKYVLIDGLRFEHCGTRSIANGSLGNAGLHITDSGGESSYVIIRDCDFERNSSDIAIAEGSNTIHYVLIEENRMIFDNPWEHFYGAFSSSNPYVQIDSWSHIKGSGWEKHAIFGQGNNSVVVRRNYVRGQQIIGLVPESSTSANMKHFYQHDNEIEDCWDDAMGDIEGDGGVNAILHGDVVTNATAMIGLSPYNSGPLWLFCCSIDGFVHYPLKLGNQAAADESHGVKTIANISARAVDWLSNDYRIGAQLILGGHSGLTVSNYVLHSFQNGDDTEPTYWLAITGSHSFYTVLQSRTNEWHNSYLFVQNNESFSTAVVPEIRWRAAGAYPGAGTLTDYSTFAAANTGIGTTDTQFYDMVGAYSDNGDPAPFLTSIEDGLNPSLNYFRSERVRGITDEAGDNDGNSVPLSDLPIGMFPLRDPDSTEMSIRPDKWFQEAARPIAARSIDVTQHQSLAGDLLLQVPTLNQWIDFDAASDRQIQRKNFEYLLTSASTDDLLLRVPSMSEWYDHAVDQVLRAKSLTHLSFPFAGDLLLRVPPLDQWYDAIAEPLKVAFLPLQPGEHRTELSITPAVAPDLSGTTPVDQIPAFAAVSLGEHVTSYDYSSPAPAPDPSGLYAADTSAATASQPTLGAAIPLDYSQPAVPDIVAVASSAVIPMTSFVDGQASSGFALAGAVNLFSASPVGLAVGVGVGSFVAGTSHDLATPSALAGVIATSFVNTAHATFAAPNAIIPPAVLLAAQPAVATALVSPTFGFGLPAADQAFVIASPQAGPWTTTPTTLPNGSSGPLEPSLFTEPLIVDWWQPINDPVRRIQRAQATIGALGVEPSVLVEPSPIDTMPGSGVITVVGPSSGSLNRAGPASASITKR